MNTHLLFLGIPKNTSSADLRAFCTVDDVTVTSVTVRVNAVTGRGEGVGFVTFASVDETARATELLASKQLRGKTPQIRVPSQQETTSFIV